MCVDMKKIKLWLLSCSLVVLISCSGNSVTKKTTPQIKVEANIGPAREIADKLTQKHANARKLRVSNIEYTLDIDLISKVNAYSGQVEIEFDLKDRDDDLTIDFSGGKVYSTVINGKEQAVNYSGYFITLSADSLIKGRNKIIVDYSHQYDQDGTGLHRFVEPEDNRTYLYTYLWPYYANKLFPNFDQPNLKATYELSVRAKKNWQVISSVLEDKVIDEGESRLWHFPRSKKFSSYIFSLHAGPYKVWEDTAGDIPIRLFSRQSLAEYVPVKEWFDFTKMGLSHYRKYFDIAYPFEKYDQVIVPDFNIGAMENVAAVTFTEYVIQRGPSSRFQRQNRANIILHEMAHMWFGNLVTKNWWNGLWLNESFATLMASIAVSNLPEFSDLWHDFYLNTNLSAINADKKVSTHPIEIIVPSTDDFFAVFDTITYDKGASVLNQLSHYTGQENFRLGVSKYLKQHSWGNTELSDFVESQSSQSGLKLDSWSKDWLYNAGVNKIKADYSCNNGKVNRFEIHQFNPEGFATLRSQRLQLALFDSQDKEMKPVAVKPIFISGAKTDIPELIGFNCPYVVYPNFQGWGYTEVELDNKSKHNAFEALAKTKDPLFKSMLWTSVLGSSDIDFEKYIDAVYKEKNDRIINQVLSVLSGKIDTYERQGNIAFKQAGDKLETMLWQQITQGQSSKSTRLIRLEYYISVVRSTKGKGHLKDMLNNKVNLPSLSLNQEHRWSIIRKLAVLGDEKTHLYLSKEKESDPTESGRLSVIAVDSSLADASVKDKWFKYFMEDEAPLPLSHQRVAMASLFPPNQGKFQDELMPQMIDALEVVNSTRDNYYKEVYARDLFNGVCSQESLMQMEQALDKDKIGTTLYKFLSENVQKAQECIQNK